MSSSTKATYEEQKPLDACALFVSGSPVGVSAPLLQKLAAQVDFILAVDAGANQLQQAGIVPDLLIGDLDSISADTLASYQDEAIAIESFDAYKNATDVELGIETLHARGFTRIIATNVLGGRSDHALGSLGALAGAVRNYDVDVRVYDEQESCFFVCSKQEPKYLQLDMSEWQTLSNTPQNTANAQDSSELHLPEHLSLISWGGTNTVSLTGTEWELDHHELSSYSARGVSNVVRSSHVKLTVHEGSGVVLLLLTHKQPAFSMNWLEIA